MTTEVNYNIEEGVGYICISKVQDLNLLVTEDSVDELHIRIKDVENVDIDKVFDELINLKSQHTGWTMPVALTFDAVRLSLSPGVDAERHLSKFKNMLHSFKVSHIKLANCSPKAFDYIIEYCKMNSFSVNVLMPREEGNVPSIGLNYLILSNKGLEGAITSWACDEKAVDIKKHFNGIVYDSNEQDLNECVIFSKLTSNARAILSEYYKGLSTDGSDANEHLSTLLEKFAAAKITALPAAALLLKSVVSDKKKTM